MTAAPPTVPVRCRADRERNGHNATGPQEIRPALLNSDASARHCCRGGAADRREAPAGQRGRRPRGGARGAWWRPSPGHPRRRARRPAGRSPRSRRRPARSRSAANCCDSWAGNIGVRVGDVVATDHSGLARVGADPADVSWGQRRAVTKDLPRLAGMGGRDQVGEPAERSRETPSIRGQISGDDALLGSQRPRLGIDCVKPREHR